jgi:hypothetical protein
VLISVCSYYISITANALAVWDTVAVVFRGVWLASCADAAFVVVLAVHYPRLVAVSCLTVQQCTGLTVACHGDMGVTSLLHTLDSFASHAHSLLAVLLLSDDVLS